MLKNNPDNCLRHLCISEISESVDRTGSHIIQKLPQSSLKTIWIHMPQTDQLVPHPCTDSELVVAHCNINILCVKHITDISSTP